MAVTVSAAVLAAAMWSYVWLEGDFLEPASFWAPAAAIAVGVVIDVVRALRSRG